MLLFTDIVIRIKRWRIVSDANDSYLPLFTELFRAVLRQLRGHTFDLPFPLTETQTNEAHNLIKVLLRSDSSGAERVLTLQTFLWTLVSERRTQPWKNIFQFFFAFLALRVDGTYACAAILSPELAKMKYLIHTACMAETLQQPEEEQATYVIFFSFPTC